MTENVSWHNSSVTRRQREARNRHKGVVVWFTGLPASGKSTIALALEAELFRRGCQTVVLDGDNIRHGLCADLGFSKEDRKENLRRVGELAGLFIESGVIVLAAFVSPCQSDRNQLRNRLPQGDFVEVYCACDLETCKRRDPKGLYQRAMAGEIEEFTGISSPYDVPVRAELTLKTDDSDVTTVVGQVIACLEKRGVMKKRNDAVSSTYQENSE